MQLSSTICSQVVGAYKGAITSQLGHFISCHTDIANMAAKFACRKGGINADIFAHIIAGYSPNNEDKYWHTDWSFVRKLSFCRKMQVLTPFLLPFFAHRALHKHNNTCFICKIGLCRKMSLFHLLSRSHVQRNRNTAQHHFLWAN